MKIIKKEEVVYIGKLARIRLADSELESLSKQLNDILSYINTLNKVDTKDVPPTSHVLNLSNVYREDILKASLDVKDALANAPDKHEGYFKVPKVIEDN